MKHNNKKRKLSMDTMKPISMKSLGEDKVKSKIQIIVFTVLFTSLSMLAGRYVIESLTEEVIPNAPLITLEDVIIAYSPETKNLIFLDRETGEVEFTLSDSISLAIFALKSSEIISDYSDKVTK